MDDLLAEEEVDLTFARSATRRVTLTRAAALSFQFLVVWYSPIPLKVFRIQSCWDATCPLETFGSANFKMHVSNGVAKLPTL
eukprot:4346495-Amphidinium_carterae.1